MRDSLPVGAIRESFFHEDTGTYRGEAQFSFCEIPMNRVRSQVTPIWRISTASLFHSRTSVLSEEGHSRQVHR